jgi:hypothetical protein
MDYIKPLQQRTRICYMFRQLFGFLFHSTSRGFRSNAEAHRSENVIEYIFSAARHGERKWRYLDQPAVRARRMPRLYFASAFPAWTHHLSSRRKLTAVRHVFCAASQAIHTAVIPAKAEALYNGECRSIHFALMHP